MEQNGSGGGSLKWLFLDLNSYFASVEQQERPELREKPVAILPMMTDHTCVIAASYEAKAYGVKTGTGVREARKMCPGLRCVLARHDKYVEYHYRIMDEIERHLHISRVCSIDEVACLLLGRERRRANALSLARQIKEGIWRNVGAEINCSIGLAPNSFLAKVATEMQKPDGLVALEHKDLPEPLFRLRLTDLPGINVNMERRLNRAGVFTVEQFWNLSPKHARHIWGSVGGERFWYNLRGYDVPEQETKRRVIGHSRVLDPEIRSPEAARQMARRLTVKAASRMRRENFFATVFFLSARTCDYRRWAGEVRLHPSADNHSFLEALDGLWDAMLADFSPYIRLKKVSVTLTGLCRREEITPDLFDTGSPAVRKQLDRHENLSGAIDMLNRKYGAETVRLGCTPGTRAGHVGTKISFTRIPEMAEFTE